MLVDQYISKAQESSKQKFYEKYMSIYSRLDNLCLKEETIISERVKYLIKNMFDHKNSGW